MSKVFRKEVLEKLQSPDRLNEMVQITSPRSWLALIGIAGILLSLIVWGFMGSIPESVNGRGILIQHGGVIEVASSGSGAVNQIIAREGDRVEAGDAVAYLFIPELELQISSTSKKLEDLNGYYNELTNFDQKDLAMRRELTRQKIQLQQQIIESNELLINFYDEKIAQEKILLDEKLITKETLMRTQDDFFKIQQQNEALKRELQSIDLDMFETEQQRKAEEKNIKLQIFEWERKLDELKAMLDLSGTIKSPVSGRVIELLANTGNQITSGTVIMRVEQRSKDEKLEAIVYVGGTEGKRIEPGMKVKLAPSTVEVEEYGFIWGTVTYVSEYPSSYQGIVRVLGNEHLAQSFLTTNSPPIAVRLSLDKDSSTFSGFKWTSGDGPPTKIRTGTICQTRIEVDESTPLELLFVKFNRLKSVDRW
ncbi:MAG: NHLP bacteriocin system secretion protein [Vicingaceae bacterium]